MPQIFGSALDGALRSGMFLPKPLELAQIFLDVGSIVFRDVRALSIQRGGMFPCSFRNPFTAEPEQESKSWASLGIIGLLSTSINDFYLQYILHPQVIKTNGRPVGTRTPDLCRVKGP